MILTFSPPFHSSRRDSNFGRRQSFSGSVNTGPPPLSVNVTIRDPRPIKDKAFQRTLIHNLVNFLIQSGFQYALTTKNLYQPTNKIFQDIFKFLYLKLEPGHEFQKKFEDEVPSLLTIMRLAKGPKKKRTGQCKKGRREQQWPGTKKKRARTSDTAHSFYVVDVIG
jgi:kinetochore protein NDC80